LFFAESFYGMFICIRYSLSESQTKMPKVFITRQIPEAGINLLTAKGFEVEVASQDGAIDRAELLKSVKGVDAILSLLTDKVDGELLDAAGSQLKIVANYAVGYDNIDLAAAKERGVLISNTPEVLSETVAEHTFALLLAIAHRVVESDTFMRGGKYKGWGPMMLLGRDMSHKTLGVVGLGRIGSLVVKHAVKGFDMQVLYYDVKPNPAFEAEYGAKYVQLPELLSNADFVSIHVPLLPTTKHLIGATELAAMKNSAYLVNTSRGPIVDETALVAALKDNVIAGAAIDVFENEPKMAPGLAELDNVIITPHIASATVETRDKMAQLAAENIIAALEGNTPPTLVQMK